MDIEKRIVRAQEEIKKIKTSQAIGQSNSCIYTIVNHGTLSVTTSSQGRATINLSFKSNARAFPHLKLVINSHSTTGSTVPSFTSMFIPYLNNPTEQEDIYADKVSIYISNGGSGSTITIDYSAYADTTGVIEVL